MPNDLTGLELRSTLRKEGILELSLESVLLAEPKPTEVVVRVEAAPINPSDLGLLLGGADPSSATARGSGEKTVVSLDVPPQMMKVMAARVGRSLAVGNEGAGIVVRAGSSADARALVGKTVAMFGGGMYAEIRKVDVSQCLLLPEGTTAGEGAACFVNPLTALGMVETMRAEGHTALVHTAAASNLGQMLVKLCLADGVELVNIVRKPEHIPLLKAIGAKHVVDSSAPGSIYDLIEAVAVTGATIAFDAVGGGKLASNILSCMEAAATRKRKGFSPYGSTTHKQVYIYGGLDTAPTEIAREFGMAWGIGGWLLAAFLAKVGPEATKRLQARVARDVKTTFASHYSKTVSLVEALRPKEIAIYAAKATGEKYLIAPSRGWRDAHPPRASRRSSSAVTT
jgi:NADPH:quinone reductase-like Zn-dependent oxidoreductase